MELLRQQVIVQPIEVQILLEVQVQLRIQLELQEELALHNLLQETQQLLRHRITIQIQEVILLQEEILDKITHLGVRVLREQILQHRVLLVLLHLVVVQIPGVTHLQEVIILLQDLRIVQAVQGLLDQVHHQDQVLLLHQDPHLQVAQVVDRF